MKLTATTRRRHGLGGKTIIAACSSIEGGMQTSGSQVFSPSRPLRRRGDFPTLVLWLGAEVGLRRGFRTFVTASATPPRLRAIDHPSREPGHHPESTCADGQNCMENADRS